MTRIVRHSCRPLATNPLLDRPVGIDTARLHAMARSGFTGVTEFMEQLVARTGVEFRRLKGVMEHAVALSLQQGEPDCVTHAAMSEALQAEGLHLGVDAETVNRLQEPAAILKSKQVMGGPGHQAMETELAQLDGFVASQRQVWQERAAMLQACHDRCRQFDASRISEA